MVQPLHCKLTTPTRCALVMSAPTRDWNGFKQIFAEHWDAFQHAHPRYQTPYYAALVMVSFTYMRSEADRVLRTSQLSPSFS
jgi:hypothetical protein